MPIEARELQTWIGTEVLDSAGQKLGKLEEVYFRDGEPLAVSIRSGLGGRKHHAAALRGASVSRDSLFLAATAQTLIEATGDGLGAEQLSKLAAHDDRLQTMTPDELEGWKAREARLKAQADALAAAEKLEAEADVHGKQEDAATAKARDAEHDADDAHRARKDAEAQAQAARRDAGRD